MIKPSVVERLGAHTVAYASLAGKGENYCAMLPGTVSLRTDEQVWARIRAATAISSTRTAVRWSVGLR